MGGQNILPLARGNSHLYLSSLTQKSLLLCSIWGVGSGWGAGSKEEREKPQSPCSLDTRPDPASGSWAPVHSSCWSERDKGSRSLVPVHIHLCFLHSFVHVHQCQTWAQRPCLQMSKCHAGHTRNPRRKLIPCFPK